MCVIHAQYELEGERLCRPLFSFAPIRLLWFLVGVSVLHGVTSTERPQHIWEYEDQPLAGLTLPDTKFKTAFVKMPCFMYFLCSGLCFCALGASQWVGASELQVAESGSGAAEGTSRVRPRPGRDTEARLGTRCCRRSSPDQAPHPQKGSETIQTGIAFWFWSRVSGAQSS